MDTHEIHLGLDYTEAKADALPGEKEVDTLIRWAKHQIHLHGIAVGSQEHQDLIACADDEETKLNDPVERQLYFRSIFVACLDSGEE